MRLFITDSKRNNRIAYSAFILLLIFSSYLADLHHTIFFRPRSIHQWRQTDAASYALNYYQNDLPFFEPATHTQLGEEGRTASEFPVCYYIAGKLYKVFGFHEWMLRAIHFSFLLLGIFSFYHICIFYLKDYWISILPAFIFFSSPYIFYYGPNFLPNIPALGCILFAMLCFLLYSKENKILQLSLFFLFSALAMLLKVSEGIGFVALMFFMFISFSDISNIFQLRNNQWFYRILGFIFVVGVTFAWYSYARYYNALNHTIQNLLGTYSIFEMTGQEIEETILRAVGFDGWRSSFFSDFMFNAIVILHVLFILFWNRLDKQLKFLTALLFTGSSIYCILWFKAFYHHDYYMISPMIYIIFLVLTIVEYFKRVAGTGFSPVIAILIGIIIIDTALHNGKHQRERYYTTKFGPNDWKADYNDLEPFLRSVGIKQKDKVVTVPDPSPNITLYLMNQPGWSECFNADDYNIKLFSQKGAKYLIIGDPNYLNDPLYQPFIGKKLGQHKSILVYEIKK